MQLSHAPSAVLLLQKEERTHISEYQQYWVFVSCKTLNKRHSMVGDKHTSLSFLAFESWQGSENKMSSNKSTVAEIQPLYTSAGLNLGDRHLGEVERDSFITGHQGRSPGQLAIKRPEPPEGFQGKVFFFFFFFFF